MYFKICSVITKTNILGIFIGISSIPTQDFIWGVIEIGLRGFVLHAHLLVNF